MVQKDGGSRNDVDIQYGDNSIEIRLKDDQMPPEKQGLKRKASRRKRPPQQEMHHGGQQGAAGYVIEEEIVHPHPRGKRGRRSNAEKRAMRENQERAEISPTQSPKKKFMRFLNTLSLQAYDSVLFFFLLLLNKNQDYSSY